jgi:hypothetical protein
MKKENKGRTLWVPLLPGGQALKKEDEWLTLWVPPNAQLTIRKMANMWMLEPNVVIIHRSETRAIKQLRKLYASTLQWATQAAPAA